MPSIRDGLPAAYRDLLPPLFGEQMPEEAKATCAACAMCAGTGGGGGSRVFRPDVKCCSFHPRLAKDICHLVIGDNGRARKEVGEEDLRRQKHGKIQLMMR